MEHSTLHALQLIGLLVAAGGLFFVLGLLSPSQRALADDPARVRLGASFLRTSARWIAIGAAAAALATFLDFFVQTAEVQGRTILGGAHPATVYLFATTTTVGQISLARMLALVFVALVMFLPGRSKWWLAGLATAVAVTCAALVSHAAAQPAGRDLALGLQLLHLVAGAAWIGVLFHLLAARRSIESAVEPPAVQLIAEMVRRFSPLALTASSLLLVSGGVAAYRALVTPSGALTSAYGLTLLIKLTLLLLVLAAGWTNFRVIRPALLRLPGWPAPAVQSAAPAVLRRFGRTLELEVTAGILVIVVAGIVGSVSPPRDDTAIRLTPVQTQALLSPDLPTSRLIDASVFYGAPTRTLDDLLYAEFTHNWSGVFVTILGLFWLAQSLGGRFSSLAERAWPLLMIPFAGFIAVAADPEVFILRRVTLAQALADPQILEHQTGALLVLVMMWLGWRDRRRPPDDRPLGLALPAIFILGSVLLLGHAHSSFNSTQPLTNLINVQHAVLGGLGLFAGTVRWLSLRCLFFERSARVLWPGFIVLVGLFMAFFYREVI